MMFMIFQHLICRDLGHNTLDAFYKVLIWSFKALWVGKKPKYDWNGEEMFIQSRAIDETGYIQPTIEALQAERGVNSIYHNNAIATWMVNKDGSVDNVRLG